MEKFDLNRKLGILGGGQLGKMLALAAGDWHLPIYALDKSSDFPASVAVTKFVEGDFRKYEDVYAFGQQVDVLTVEIEDVNTDALKQLVREGKTVHPAPDKLELIKDKGLQKQFYAERGLPSSDFGLYPDAAAIRSALQKGDLTYPFVQKARTAGYDGQGVAVIRSEDDQLLNAPSVVEDLVDIEKELAVVVAKNEQGDIAAYPVVEMAFHPTANLVEYLLCPARIEPALVQQAIDLAKSVIDAFDLCGLLAVELFWTKSGDLLINEVAPRPHNSGHHTIDSCVTSQFEQHIRAVLNLPLGDTSSTSTAVMANILGAPKHRGPAIYDGMDACLAIPGVHVHLYGKADTKPFRKMGHITVVDQDTTTAIAKAKQVKAQLQVISKENA